MAFAPVLSFSAMRTDHTLHGQRPRPLTTIGVFYDGNYFNHVSTYYKYSHPRRARLSIAGLHRFIRHQVAHIDPTLVASRDQERAALRNGLAGASGRKPVRDELDEVRHCQIVDAHYFRGRLAAMEAAAKDSLLNERLFEDVLMKEGVITHSLPLVRRRDQTLAEKGLDVWFALETYELTALKRYDVTALVACDRDYLPLVRKLNTLGACVMVLGWDFTHMDEMGVERQTVTSIDLLQEATYPLAMHDIIESADRDDALVNGLFVEDAGRLHALRPTAETEAAVLEADAATLPAAELRIDPEKGPAHLGIIQTLKEGYGFISTETPSKNLFFSWADLLEVPFDALRVGDRVGYFLGTNFKGECATGVHKLSVPATAAV
jgi:cold shock CspA family protein